MSIVDYDIIDIKTTKFMKFTKIKYKNKKTFDVLIDQFDKDHDDTSGSLGTITWLSSWRTYTYKSPSFAEVWLDPGCMTEIIKYINELLEERKLVIS